MNRIKSASNSSLSVTTLRSSKRRILRPSLVAMPRLLHLGQQAVDRALAEPRAGPCRRAEEHDLEIRPLAALPQQRVDDEQELEHRPAAHRAGLVRIAGEADRDGAALQRLEPSRDFLAGGDAVARNQGVLDARQFANEFAAGRHDQMVVVEFAAIGDDGAAVVLQPDHRGLDEIDAVLAKKCASGTLRPSPLRSRAGIQITLGRKCSSLRGEIIVIVASTLRTTQLPRRGEGGKPRADDGNVGHGTRPPLVPASRLVSASDPTPPPPGL